jgi:ASC-1-like (ASCH) protein
MSQKSLFTLAALAAGSVAFCYYYYYFRKKKNNNSTERKYHSEVIMFPDRRLDVNESKIEKGKKFKEILNASRPLDRLLSHIAEAEETIDVCLYLITSQQLANGVLARIKVDPIVSSHDKL